MLCRCRGDPIDSEEPKHQRGLLTTQGHTANERVANPEVKFWCGPLCSATLISIIRDTPPEEGEGREKRNKMKTTQVGTGTM